MQTIVLSYADHPVATPEQLHTAHRIALNAALAFERITAGWSPMPVRVPVGVHDDSQPLPYSGSVARSGMWAEAARSISLQGYDPSEDLYLVYVLGKPYDWSGAGAPVWTAGQPYGWNEQANPDNGGLAVIGEAPLTWVSQILEPPKRTAKPTARAVLGPGLLLEEYYSFGRYYSKTVRERYHRQLQLTVHELGHGAGRHHPGYDAMQYPKGRPGDAVMKRSSVMAYGWVDYSEGRMATVGAFGDEIDTWRRSIHYRQGTVHYKALFQSDVAVIV